MFRDFGLTLGPAVVGGIALTRAASAISAKVAASPALGAALRSFNQAPAKAPAAQRPALEAAVGAVSWNTMVLRLKAAFPSSQAADVEEEAVAEDSVEARRKALCLSRAVSWSA